MQQIIINILADICVRTD